MNKRVAQRKNLVLHPLAVAAALLLGTTLPAQAQSFSQSGANITYPNNLLPYTGGPASLDFTGDTVVVGNGGIGSFSVLAGAMLKADALALASGGTGAIGTFTISGVNASTAARSTVQLVGTGNRLAVGGWGIGTLTVSGGALLDATLNAAACGLPGASCGGVVGDGAGSTGTLTVTGNGSEVRLLRFFTVSQTSVVTNPPNSSTFGTPGGTTSAAVNVLAGGTLRTERAVVGVNTASPNGLGTEQAFGTVVVDGAGSLWELTRNSIDATNNVAGLTIGINANGTGDVVVKNGGTLRVVGSSASDNPTTFINIGSNGGKGTLTLTGTNSKLEMLNPVPVVNGAGSVIQAGRIGAGSEGTFSVLAGATASATFLNVGRDGANGTVLIDGTGSLVTLSGLGTWASGQVGGAASSIGWNGGHGKVTVSNGGRLLVTDGGVDTSTSAGSMAINLGYIGGTGQMFIDGAGSTVEITSTSIAPAPGTADNFNPFMAIGRDSGGTGELTITNGGKLLLTGNALSTPANPRGTSLSIGGTSAGSGTGTATVTGAGSQIVLSGDDSNISVGRSAGGDGTFSILAGATASAVFLIIGRDAGTGTLLLDGSGSKLSQSGQGVYNSGGVGPALGLVGWGGTGQAVVSNGAIWSVTDGFDTSALPSRGPTLYVGVNSGASNGTGTLTISGTGARVELSSTSIAPAPGAADNFNPVVRVGNGTGNTGTIDIIGGGQLVLTGNALSTPSFGRQTNLFIGGDSDTAAGGTGTVTISGAGSQVRLEGTDTFLIVGRNGNGTLSLDNKALLHIGNGGLNVGRAASGVGVLNVNNSAIEINGQFSSDTSSGAFLSVGNRGGNGTANIDNGSVVTLTNTGSSGASLNVGGTATNPLGTGVLNLTGGSTISLVAAPGLATMNVGRDGTGTATLSGTGTQIDIGDGGLHVGRLPTGVGVLSIQSGAKVLTGNTNIGGSSDTDAGGIGSVTVSGAGSELRASGASGFIGVGRSGTGTLTVGDQAQVSAIGMGVGRSSGGNGTLIASNATLAFAGQQTTGTLSGAFFNIGQGGGSGNATLSGTTVTLTNAGSAGATINVGGSGALPLGTGTLTMVNSSVTVTAQAGLGAVSIGRNGTGTATLTNSTITNEGGNIYVGRESGSTGVLALTNGSIVEAGFVGIGVSAKYDGVAQANGGTGILVLNNSTIRTAGFELGAGSVLTGNGGTIEIIPSSGDVVIGGTIAPGNSPGKLRIRCNIIMLAGSRIVLEVSGNGDSMTDYAWDELIIDSNASFDLASAHIEFSFLGDTNPNQFAAIGGMNLDNFLRAETGTTTTGLSEVFAAQGKTWSDVVDTSTITAVSEDPAFSSITVTYDGSGNLSVAAVPEPSTWGMMFFGLAAVGAFARRRRAQADAQAAA